MTEDYSNDREHHVAILIHELMDAISDLQTIVKTDYGYQIVKRDFYDLDLAYTRLGAMLHALEFPLEKVA